MRPVRFSTTAVLPITPQELADQILDVSNWKDFRGYGPLPGIRSADFLVRTDEVVGSRIQVTNTDGSSHVEEIVEWNPEQCIRFLFSEFTSPLSTLATSFDEYWELNRDGDETHVVRSFQMHPRSALTKPVLWLISFPLKQAIEQHLRQLAG